MTDHERTNILLLIDIIQMILIFMLGGAVVYLLVR